MKAPAAAKKPSALADVWKGMGDLARRLVTAEAAIKAGADQAGRLASAEARIAALEARLSQ